MLQWEVAQWEVAQMKFGGEDLSSKNKLGILK